MSTSDFRRRGRRPLLSTRYPLKKVPKTFTRFVSVLDRTGFGAPASLKIPGVYLSLICIRALSFYDCFFFFFRTLLLRTIWLHWFPKAADKLQYRTQRETNELCHRYDSRVVPPLFLSLWSESHKLLAPAALHSVLSTCTPHSTNKGMQRNLHHHRTKASIASSRELCFFVWEIIIAYLNKIKSLWFSFEEKWPSSCKSLFLCFQEGQTFFSVFVTNTFFFPRKEDKLSPVSQQRKLLHLVQRSTVVVVCFVKRENFLL